MMTKIAVLFVVSVFVAGCATQSVLRMNQDRIVFLAQQAITEQESDVDMNRLEFSGITYRLDATWKENLRVTFRHSPETETETTGDKERRSTRTVTKCKMIVVEMDKAGNILSVDAGGNSSQFTVKSTRRTSVQQSDREATSEPAQSAESEASHP